MIKPGKGILLEDGQEYVCLETTQLEGKDYIYLVTLEEPYSVCFAEQQLIDGEPQIRIINEKALKEKLFPLFQAKIKQRVDEAAKSVSDQREA